MNLHFELEKKLGTKFITLVGLYKNSQSYTAYDSLKQQLPELNGSEYETVVAWIAEQLNI